MPDVGYVNSSNTGVGDAQGSSVDVPVPAGAAAGMDAYVAIEMWETINPTVTVPSGFVSTPVVDISSGSQKLKIFRKRLTAADTGNWTFSWTGTVWRQASAVLIENAQDSTPTGAQVVTTTGGGLKTPLVSGAVATTEPFLLHFVANENSGNQNVPPTEFTEVQDQNYLATNYRIPGIPGTFNASGGSKSVSTVQVVALIAIEAAQAADARDSVDLTFVGSSAWVAPSVATSIVLNYPASLVEGDRVYAELHCKSNLTTVETPDNWEFVARRTGGSGSQGAGTGSTVIYVYRRNVPSGGLSGTQTFTIAGASTLVGCMAAWRSTDAAAVFEQEVYHGWTVTVASTTIGGAAGDLIPLAPKDVLRAVFGTADDQSTTLTLTGLASTGITFGSVVQSPAGSVVNALGNDISAAAGHAVVTAGTASNAPTATATSNSSETATGCLYRIRASKVAGAAPNHSADFFPLFAA